MPCSVAPRVLNVTVAVFSSLDTNVYQFVCTEQKAPDNPEADRSLQNCGSMPPLWHLDFCKMCVPQVCPWCDRAAVVYRAVFLYNECTGPRCLSFELSVYSVWPPVYRVALL